MSQTGPNDPQPVEDPTHDVPVYPEQDPPPGQETDLEAAHGGPGDIPPAESGEDDVDEDDLDPQTPHSPPDTRKGRVIFDENKVVAS